MPASMSDNLEGFWCPSIDDSADDLSGNSRDGTYQNSMGTSTTDDDHRGVREYDFDGTGDYIDLDSHASAVASLSEGTVAAWFKTDGDAGTQVILGASDSADASSEIQLALEANKVRWSVREAGTYSVLWDSTSTYNDSAWHHVAVTVDSNGTTIFIDGVEDSGTYTNGSAASTEFFHDVNDIDAFRIGNNEDSGGHEAYFDGLIDGVTVFSRVLSPAEIRYAYSAGRQFAWHQNPATNIPYAVQWGILQDDVADDPVEMALPGFGQPAGGLFWTGNAAVGAFNPTTDAICSIGFWDTRNQYSCGMWSDSSANDAGRTARDDDGLGIYATARVAEYQAAEISNGVQMAMSYDNTGLNRFFGSLLFSSDCTVECGEFTPNSSDGGTASITGLQDEPDLLFFTTSGATNGSAGAGAILSFGVAINDGSETQYAWGVVSQGVATGEDRVLWDNRCGGQVTPGGITWSLEVTSFNSDGATMTTRDGATGGDECYYMAIYLNGADFSFDNLEGPATTGTDSLTGLSFQPDAQIFGFPGTSTDNSVQDNNRGSHGVCDSNLAQNVTGWRCEDGVNNTGSIFSPWKSIYLTEFDTDTLEADAFIESLNSDGSTLNWEATYNSRDGFQLSLEGAPYTAGDAVEVIQTKTGTASAADTLDITLDSSVTANSAIVVAILDWTGLHSFTVTDDQGNSYTLREENDLNSGRQALICVAEGASSGSTTITVDCDAISNYCVAVIEADTQGNTGLTYTTDTFDNSTNSTTLHCATATNDGITLPQDSLCIAAGTINSTGGTIYPGAGWTDLISRGSGAAPYGIVQYIETTRPQTKRRGTWTQDTARQSGAVLVCISNPAAPSADDFPMQMLKAAGVI